MPKLISAKEITELADMVESSMEDTCILARYEDVDARYGGRAGTAVPYGTVDCHVSSGALVTPEFRVNADQSAPDTLWAVLLPRGTEVNDNDLVLWSGGHEGGTLQVVERLPRTWEVVRRLYCRNANDITL